MTEQVPLVLGRKKMTVTEAADFLNRDPETIRRYIRKGVLPCHRIGKLGDYILYKDELEKLMK